MTRAILWLALLGGGGATIAPAALAQPAPAPDHPADQALAEGRALYDLREWDQAIAKFKEAYRLRPDPASLFNIAQSYRLKGNCAEAAGFYKTYKRNFPNEANIAKVERFIAEMEECAKQQPPPVTEPGPVEPPPPTPPAPVTPAPGLGPPASTPAEHGSPGRTLRITGIVAGSIGAACLIGGVGSALQARSAANEIEGLDVWNPSLDERGQRAALRAKILLGVGGGALVAGSVMYFVGRSQGERRSAVSFVPQGDGGLVVWSGGF